MSDLRTITGLGRLIHEQTELQTRYRLYVDPSGRATMIELLDRPDGFASDLPIRVRLQDGRYVSCRVLDDTPMCAVIGDGILPRERNSPAT